MVVRVSSLSWFSVAAASPAYSERVKVKKIHAAVQKCRSECQARAHQGVRGAAALLGQVRGKGDMPAYTSLSEARPPLLLPWHPHNAPRGVERVCMHQHQ